MSQEFLAALKNAPDEEQQTTAAEEAAKIAPDELKNVVVASKVLIEGKEREREKRELDDIRHCRIPCSGYERR